MTRVALAAVAAVVTAGCDAGGCRGAGERAEPLVFAEEVAAPGGESPSRVVIENRTGERVRLSAPREDRPLVSVAPLRAALGICALDLGGEAGRVELAPLSTHETSWNGRLARRRRGPDGRILRETFPPPPGLYMLEACDATGRYCGLIRTRLPTRMPLVIPLARRVATVERCPVGEELARRLATYHLVRLDLRGEGGSRLGSCDPAGARCVDQHELPAALEGPGEAGCEVLVVPRRSEIETVVVLSSGPPPAGPVRFSASFDALGARLVSVRRDGPPARSPSQPRGSSGG
jgi:hypothetical protein